MTATLPPLTLSHRARRTAPAALTALTLALAGALTAHPAQAADDAFRIAGTWASDQPGTLAVDESLTLTDPDGDGTFEATTTAIPTGALIAEVWQDGTPLTSASWGWDAPSSLYFTRAGMPVTFRYTPGEGDLEIEPALDQRAYWKVFDAFWIDEDTVAYPRAVPGDGDAPADGDTYVLYGNIPSPTWSWSEGSEFDSRATNEGPGDFTVGTFTEEQLAALPQLENYVALDATAESRWTRETQRNAEALRQEVHHLTRYTDGVASARVDIELGPDEAVVFGREIDSAPGAGVAVPGTHNTALGCSSDAALNCGALTRDERSGLYRGTFSVPAGSYEFQLVVDGEVVGEPHRYTWGTPGAHRYQGTPITFVADPATGEVFTSATGLYTVGGMWSAAQRNQYNTSPFGNDLSLLLRDPDGDGIWTLTTDRIPSGVWRAGIGTDLEWADQRLTLTTDANMPVTFRYDAAADTFTAEASAPGLFDASVDRAFWVDRNTIAYPADVPATPDGQPRPFDEDGIVLYWDDKPVALTWDDPFTRAGGIERFRGQYAEKSATLTPSQFTAEQLAAHPELADYIALDVPATITVTNSWDEEARTIPVPDAVELADQGLELSLVRGTGEPREHFDDIGYHWVSIMGVHPAGEGPLEIPIPPAEEDTAPGTSGNVLLTADNEAAAARFGLDIPAGADVLRGDWDGDGVDTLAWRVGNRITFTSANEAGGGTLTGTWYGKASDDILVGDWNGDGRDTLGVRRGNEFHLANNLDTGRADVFFWYGKASDDVAVGDWNGDERDTVAVRRSNEWHLTDALRTGNAQHTFWYGRPGEPFLIGDLDGDGVDSVVIRRGADYHLKNALQTGNADRVVTFGDADDTGLAGDWNGDGTDTLGVVVR